MQSLWGSQVIWMLASRASSRLYHLVHPPYAPHFRIPIPLSAKTTCRHWKTLLVECYHPSYIKYVIRITHFRIIKFIVLANVRKRDLQLSIHGTRTVNSIILSSDGTHEREDNSISF